jgi:hypothetical protein
MTIKVLHPFLDGEALLGDEAPSGVPESRPRPLFPEEVGLAEEAVKVEPGMRGVKVTLSVVGEGFALGGEEVEGGEDAESEEAAAAALEVDRCECDDGAGEAVVVGSLAAIVLAAAEAALLLLCTAAPPPLAPSALAPGQRTAGPPPSKKMPIRNFGLALSP